MISPRDGRDWETTFCEENGEVTGIFLGHAKLKVRRSSQVTIVTVGKTMTEMNSK